MGALTMEDLIVPFGNIVKEELESAVKRIWTKFMGILRDGDQKPIQRNLKLQFKNRISKTIVTTEEIKGEDKNPLEVALVDESTGNIVDRGPESSAIVKIFPLKGVPNASQGGGWTVEQFNENIVRGLNKHLLAENNFVQLKNGIGFLENIKFRHDANEMSPSALRLGAKVVHKFHGVHIKEAKTEPFELKNYRNKYDRKKEIPSLSDEVSQLRGISKRGETAKRLRAQEIRTVKDFLLKLHTDSEGLKKIVKLKGKKWGRLVQSALACLSTERLLASTNTLPQRHKVDAESDCKHKEKIESFDDVHKFLERSNSLGCPVDCSKDAGTPETIRGSGRTSNIPSSAMNPIGEAGGKDFSPFGTDAYSQLPPLDYGDFNSENLDSFSCSVDCSEDAGTSQMIRGSGSTSNILSSAMNPIGEAGGKDFSPFDTDAYSQLNPSSTWNLDDIFPNVGELLNQNDNQETKLTKPTNESNAKSFDDRHHFPECLNSLYCPVDGYKDAGTSEMNGASSSRSNFSIGEIGVENFSTFGNEDEIMPDAFLQLSPLPLEFHNLFPGFEEFLNQKDNQDAQLHGPINESNADEVVESIQITGSPSKKPKLS